MISLKNKKRLSSAPPAVLTSETCLQKITDIKQNPLTHTVNSHYNHSTVKEELQKYHKTKCVYCESDTSAGASFRVDHYRPKRHIKELPEDEHYGYYWLAYEWTNFLQSCEACNREKSNHFPLSDESTRVTHVIPTPDAIAEANTHPELARLSSEKRLLLHPEIDNVEEYLVFKSDGSVVPTTDAGKKPMAEESIKRYKLYRGNLIKARKRKVDRFFNDLVDILNDYEDRGADDAATEFLYSDLKKYFKRMLREQDEDVEYSRVGFYMFDNFKEFYIDRLTEYGDIYKVEDYYKLLAGIR